MRDQTGPGPIGRRRNPGRLGAAVLVVVTAAVGALIGVPGDPGTRPAAATATPAVEFAVVGDFGTDSTAEGDVAAMVAAWNPAFVATTGDNYYASVTETGTARYDRVVGAYYCAFLAGAAPGPRCASGGTSATNRFFPATGNHDWTDGDITNYRAYFALPGAGVTSQSPTGSELVYDVRRGPVHLFFLDSQAALASGSEATAQQAWVQSALAASDAPWKIVVLHHPPYSSGSHGSSTALRWPFAAWGADLVLSGHDHTYERVSADGIPYLVNGLGGAPRYSFAATPVTGSELRYAANWGALRVRADDTSLTSEFVSLTGEVVDRVALTTTPTPTPTTTVRLQDGVDGYSGTRDTTLVQAVPSATSGTATTLLVDGDDPPGTGQDLAMLLRFDTSAIPAGAVVQSATLAFDVVNASVHGYQAFEVLRAWDEATASWNLAAAGTPWATPGAAGAADRGAALGTLSAPSVGPTSVVLDATGRAAVQAWISGTRANHGLVIAATTPTDGIDVTSREGATPAARPALVVTYSFVGGTPPTTTPPTTTPPTTTPPTTTPPSTVSPVWTAACAGTLAVTRAGTVADGAVHEASGVVASRRNPGVWWLHNDSGDSARIFAMGDDGRALGQFTLSGAAARDWEDIAVGPGPVPGTPYLYVGDIGDNSAARPSVVVYRVAEPAVTAPMGVQTLSGVDALTLTYPNGARNAEALLVDPATGALFVVTKTSSGPAEVYRAPAGLAGGSTTVLTRVGSYPLGVVTGADVTPAGDVVAVRTYSSVTLFRRPSGSGLETAFESSACAGPVPAEAQGEAVGFLADGSGYVTIGEGDAPPVWRVAPATPPPTTPPPTTPPTTVRPAPPGAFAKVAPGNRSVAARTARAADSARTVTLRWSSASGATGYEVCLDRDQNSTCNSGWVTVGAATSRAVPVVAGRPYSWQVRARNAAGTTVADTGTWWRFTGG